MNKRVKKEWIEALRGGEYKQSFGTLREIGEDGETRGFCCLGVLCNLHALEHPKIAANQLSPKSYLGSTSVLSVEVMEWAGLSDPQGIVWNGGNDSLTAINDSGKSFKYIAAQIEKRA